MADNDKKGADQEEQKEEKKPKTKTEKRDDALLFVLRFMGRQYGTTSAGPEIAHHIRELA